MIIVYLDESEQSSVSKYMTLAGFFGNDQQWASFGPEWQTALGRKKALHMNALRINSKPERAKKLLDRLAPLPYKHGLKPISSIVKIADYLDLIEDGLLARKALHGYTVCFSAILDALNRVIPGHESINIVCETQKEHGEQAYRMFRALRIKMADPARPYFAELKFVPKGSCIFTQPADFLAFAITHWHEDKTSLISEICKPILGNGSTYGHRLERTQVRDIISKTKDFVKSHNARW